jgi:hypothetical protein
MSGCGMRDLAHSVTIPLHSQMKTGTLHGILSEVAQMRSVSIETLTELL